MSHRQHVAAEARNAAALGACDRLRAQRKGLGEGRAEHPQDGDVESVEPDDGLAGAASAIVAMVVPGPGRCDDEIARRHPRTLAIDRGVGPAAIDHEPQCRLRVPVTRRDLSGQDQLQTGVQAGRDQRLPAQRRVLEDQHATDRFLGTDQRAGLRQVRMHVRPAPERRHTGLLRFGRHERVQHLPQRRHVEAADPCVEVLAPRAGCGRGLVVRGHAVAAMARHIVVADGECSPVGRARRGACDGCKAW